MALSLKIPFFRTTIITFTPQKKLSAQLCRLSRPSKRLKIECRKKDLHPTFYDEAKVYCDGEFVMTTSGTQSEYNIDTWSGNHPFYLGQTEYDDDDYYGYDDEEDEEEEEIVAKTPSK